MAVHYVRLYPYEKKRGYLVQKFCLNSHVYIGGQRPTWYVVDDALAAVLATKRQVHNDPDSKPLFQILTKEEKEQVAKDEQEMFLASIGAVSRTVVNPITTAPPPTVNLMSAPGRAAAVPEARAPAPVVSNEVAATVPEEGGPVTSAEFRPATAPPPPRPATPTFSGTAVPPPPRVTTSGDE